MTEVPEVGSIWFDIGENKKSIVFADERTVVCEREDGTRTYYSTATFLRHNKPAPRTRKYQRWVNLYADGNLSFPFDFEKEAEEAAGHYHLYNGVCLIETRLIEWEVEE